MIALKLQGNNLQIKLKVLMAIIYEIDLYKKWVPFCNFGQNLKSVDKASKVVYLKTDPPFISDRELFLYGLGIDRLEHNGTIVIMAKSIDKDEQIQKQCDVHIEKKSKFVRVDMPFFTFQIKPLEENRLEIKAVSNLDAHLHLVPDSVVNLITRKFAFYLFEKMLEQNKKFKGSQYEKNMQKNAEFYDWIEQKIERFYQKK